MLDGFRVSVAKALAQPVTFVHRDYHSRNLMLTAERNPGVIDFQDALRGPGRLRPGLAAQGLLHRLAARARGAAGCALTAGSCSLRASRFGSRRREFMRWFDLMGLQRHIKVLGIFARLYYRDGKSGYLKDLPRVLGLRARDCGALPETSGIRRLHRRCTSRTVFGRPGAQPDEGCSERAAGARARQ